MNNALLLTILIGSSFLLSGCSYQYEKELKCLEMGEVTTCEDPMYYVPSNGGMAMPLGETKCIKKKECVQYQTETWCNEDGVKYKGNCKK